MKCIVLDFIDFIKERKIKKKLNPMLRAILRMPALMVDLKVDEAYLKLVWSFDTFHWKITHTNAMPIENVSLGNSFILILFVYLFKPFNHT